MVLSTTVFAKRTFLPDEVRCPPSPPPTRLKIESAFVANSDTLEEKDLAWRCKSADADADADATEAPFLAFVGEALRTASSIPNFKRFISCRSSDDFCSS